MAKSKKADRYGQLKQRIRKLQDEINVLRDEIIATGRDQLIGSRYVVNVLETVRRDIDWQGIAEKLEASRQMIRANTVIEDVTQVRVQKVG